MWGRLEYLLGSYDVSSARWSHANELIETYLLNEYRKSRDFEAFLYMNHVLQGDAIKTAIEAHRRDMPYCMGTLFWQHNDCWPVASWASRDYYGRWKAQHYFTRKAYRDILVSPIADESGILKVQVVSDRLKSCSGKLEVSVIKLTGEVLNQYNRNVKIDANSNAEHSSPFHWKKRWTGHARKMSLFMLSCRRIKERTTMPITTSW